MKALLEVEVRFCLRFLFRCSEMLGKGEDFRSLSRLIEWGFAFEIERIISFYLGLDKAF